VGGQCHAPEAVPPFVEGRYMPKLPATQRTYEPECSLCRTFVCNRRVSIFNRLTPNDLQRRRAVSPLKIKIPNKKSQQAPLRGGI
jgi:hypothetical protein